MGRRTSVRSSFAFAVHRAHFRVLTPVRFASVQSWTRCASTPCCAATRWPAGPLARWPGLCCGPEGRCLTWSVLAASGGIGTLAYEAAGLLSDTGDDGPGVG